MSSGIARKNVRRWRKAYLFATSYRSRRGLLRGLIIASVIGSTSRALADLPGIPTGADVVAGSVAISSHVNGMNVDAATSRAIVNWDQFSISAGHTVNFNLPDAHSAILNRVVTPDMPSTINGMLSSNGNVFLVNPSGIVVGASGMINTNGFVASTFDIANDSFMAGGPLRFSNPGGNAAIVNDGTISTADGGAHLIANQIANNGTITSAGGNITLSGGGEVTLTNGVTYVQSTLGTLTSGISPTASLIQNTGTIRATGAATSGGEVYLVNPNGKILHDGTIAAHKSIDSTTNATIGGHVQFEADEIALAQNATIDVSGTHGGGSALIGGDWHGSGPMQPATKVTMEAGSVIDASATQSGNGGKIVLWSDVLSPESITRVLGSLIARGGALLGNGGQIETSGYDVDFATAHVNAGASQGSGGLWLVDPTVTGDYTLSNATSIENSLNTGTSFELEVLNGDLVIDTDVAKTTGGEATLIFKADRGITLNANKSISSTSDKLNVILWSSADPAQNGPITINGGSSILTNGGGIWMGGGGTVGGTTAWTPYANASEIQVGDGYARSKLVSGYEFGINLLGGTLDAGSGNISMVGESYVDAFPYGIGVKAVATDSDLTITGGNIFMHGNGSSQNPLFGNTGVFISASPGRTLTINASDAFTIIGQGGGTGNAPDDYAIWLYASGTQNISAGQMNLVGVGLKRDIKIETALTTNGPMLIWGGDVTIEANLIPTTDSTITLNASGRVDVAQGVTIGAAGIDTDLTIESYTDSRMSGVFTGTGDLTKSGRGYLQINTAQTYAGNTNIFGGILMLGANNVIPDLTELFIGSNGIFSLNGFNETVGSLLGLGYVENGSIVRDGIVLWLDAGNEASYSGTGNTWYDLSGNGYNGTIFGNPTYNGAQRQFEFTANNQYVQLTSLPDNFLSSGDGVLNGLTVFTLADFGTANTWERLLDLGNGSPSDNIVLSRYANSSALNFEIYQGSNINANKIDPNGTNTLIPVGGGTGTYAATANGSQFRAYADGVLALSENISVLPNEVQRDSNYIGKSNWLGDDTILGSIGVTLLYDRALSQTEILQNHEALTNRTPATLTIGANNTSALYAGRIENGADRLNLVKIGSGTQTLTGNNSYTGTTTISDGAIMVGFAGTTGTLGTGDVINNSFVVFNRTDDNTVANNISGTGVLAKWNTNQLVLTGDATYTGSTYIAAGELVFRNDLVPGTHDFIGSGALVLEPVGTSFSSNISGNSFANTLSGLTIGKVGNTADITMSSTLDIAGPVSLYGGTVDLQAVNTSGAFLASGTSLDIHGAVDAGTSDVTLETDALSLAGDVSTTGLVSIRNRSLGTTIGVGSGTGTMALGSSLLAHLNGNYSGLTIGSTTAGQLRVGDISELPYDLTLRAGSGSGVYVSGPVSWTTNHALTLAAGHHIRILDNISASGAHATLNLLYGGTDGMTVPQTPWTYYIVLANRATIDFATTTANLTIGNQAFTLIDSIGQLAYMNPSGRYALARDLDLSGATYNDAIYNSTFSGHFDGLGHAINGMTIHNTSGGNLGLFSQLNGATVRHLGVTNFDILSNSALNNNEYRVGGLVGNVGGLGTPTSSVTTLDGVWSSGVIRTQSDSAQKLFYAGGLVGSQNGGFMNVSRAYSTANVSSVGSTSSNLALGGLIGDIGIVTDPINLNHSNSATVDFDISQSYTTGSILAGSFGNYYGAGGLVGMIYTSGGAVSDSFSWSNFVGSSAFGGLAGFALPGTYTNNYSTHSTVGSGMDASASSYNGSTLSTATNNGSQLPSGWSNGVWNVGSRPTLQLLPEPPQQLFVIVNDSTSVYGDALGLSRIIVDAFGNVVNFGNGVYSNLTGVTGTEIYTLDDRAHAADHDVSYLWGLSFTGADASNYALVPYSIAGVHTVTPRTIGIAANGTATKVYDGTTEVPLSQYGLLSISNLASWDWGLTLSVGSATFNSARVLDAAQATWSGLSLVELFGSNNSRTTDYQLSTTAVSTAGEITARPIVVSGITAENKFYDGLATATVDMSGVAFNGLVHGDDVSITSIVGSFMNADPGRGKLVMLSNMIYAGADISNYQIIDQAWTLADIIVPYTPSGTTIRDTNTRYTPGDQVASPMTLLGSLGELANSWLSNTFAVSSGGDWANLLVEAVEPSPATTSSEVYIRTRPRNGDQEVN